MVSLCDRNISPLNVDRISVPFSRIIALDYRDGPTFGALQCVDVSVAYRFNLLALDVDGTYDPPAWDQGTELRIFSLAPLPPLSFDYIAQMLTSIEQPQWPVWVPGMASPSPSLRALIEREVMPILDAASHPTLVVGFRSVTDNAVISREFPQAPVSDNFDWFSYLGITTVLDSESSATIR